VHPEEGYITVKHPPQGGFFVRERGMKLRMLIPKGRIREGVTTLLVSCGVTFTGGERSYRPACSREDIEAKLLKPQNIPDLVGLGRHHCGFTGKDWIEERKADVTELLDLGMDRARIVFAVPENRTATKIVASEYPGLTRAFLKKRFPEARVIRSWGATEALPPDDADGIVDVVSSGDTLRTNRLIEVETLMETSTRFIANRGEYEGNPELRKKLDDLTTLMKSCLDARSRRLLEMNVPRNSMMAITRILPCMRSPTVAPLHDGQGFSVKAAVPTKDIPRIIPELVRLGATDILESRMERILAGGTE
jgi:ATP phosphoribosyltransferase